MCGIVATWNAAPLDPVALETDLRTATRALINRGPDDEGLWLDRELGFGLGHRRLSVIGLGEQGHQPMLSRSGRYVIAYNGEIYNHLDLRRELATDDWRGTSDTETLLAVIERDGPAAALGRLNGMFAFAVLDRRERRLTVARDRLGIKPLYYAFRPGAFLCGSTLSSVACQLDDRVEIDRAALVEFLRFGYVPTPATILRGVSKLRPGCLIEFDQRDLQRGEPGSIREYWSLDSIAGRPLIESNSRTDEEYLEEFETLLQDCVTRRMIADVPLGALLSGGIDSSTIAALMQRASSGSVTTFSIGYGVAAYDESADARRVARHLGTKHVEFELSPNDALEAIPQMPSVYDEPFADASQVPTTLISRVAREHVTVVLTGDGADELMGGYNRYTWVPRLWRQLGRFPRGARRFAGRAAAAVPPRTWDRMFGAAGRLLPASLRHRVPGDRIHKLASVIDADGPDELYRRLTYQWPDPASVVVGALGDAATKAHSQVRSDDELQRWMMLEDSKRYLLDDILVKVDRASMSVGLEARVPFLDHRLVECAWGMPHHLRIRNDTTKWAVREVLSRHVPRTLTDRPKMGFGIPIDEWLRGPLREWAESLLAPKRLADRGLLDPDVVQSAWRTHLAGTQNLQYRIWAVLMFEAWIDQFERSRVDWARRCAGAGCP